MTAREGKDVYASMAPATYTRTLGNAKPGRSPSGLHGRPHPPTLRDAAKKVRRKRTGRDALTQARKSLAAGPDLEVLALYRAATAEPDVETKVRKVRTAAGVRRYGAPIGTPIVRDPVSGKLRAKKPGERTPKGDEVRKPSAGGGLRVPGGGSGNDRGGGGRGGGGNGGGGGGGGGGGADAIGGALGGLAGLLGSLLGAGGKGKKPKKPKKPKKGRKPPKPKKGRAGASGSGKNTGADDATLDQVIDEIAAMPPDQQRDTVEALPQPILDDVSDRLLRRTGAAPPGQKALRAAWLEVKERRAAHGDERCWVCRGDVGAEYDLLPISKTMDAVICLGCADEPEQKGAPSRMPPQLMAYWSRGPGLARWSSSATPFRTLRRLLIKYGVVPERQANGATANVMHRATGLYPGQRPRGRRKALVDAVAKVRR